MNDWNDWETRLLAWAPRRPSPRVKERLFGPARDRSRMPTSEGSEGRRSRAALWPWLAPATGVLLLLVVTFSQRGFEVGRFTNSRPNARVAPSLSNQMLAVFLTGDSQSRQNGLLAGRIEWTNGGVFHSSTPSFLRTNSLKY